MFNPINFISKFIKSSNQKELDRLIKIVLKVNEHESRLEKLKNEDFPIKTKEFNDGAIIDGGTLTGGIVDSFGDHRIAMTAIIASCVSEKPIIVKNCKNIDTSFPTFQKIMNLIGMNIKEY